MQDIYKQIYEMAVSETEKPPFDFHDETVVIYKGFRAAKARDGEYSWKDVRFDDYYEEVDPLITEKVLELGFVKALTLVMIHNDHDKIIEIERRIINIDMEITYWVNQSTEIYNEKNRELNKIGRSKTLSKGYKTKRKATINKNYIKEKALYEKKRRILKSEKDDLNLDHIFYSNRIKSFNKN